MLVETMDRLNAWANEHMFFALMLLPLILHAFFLTFEIRYFQGLSRTRFRTALVGPAVAISIVPLILLIFASPLGLWQKVIFFLSFPAPLVVVAMIARWRDVQSRRRV